MAKKRKQSMGWQVRVLMIMGMFLGVVFLPTTVLLMIGMLPSIVAALVDRSKKKTKAVTVGSLNLAGCMPFLLELWENGNSFEYAFDIMTNATAIIVMYSAAAVGYLMDWALSGIVASILYQRGEARKKAIKKRQKELQERWGKEVTGRFPLDEHGFAIEAKSPPKEKPDHNN